MTITLTPEQEQAVLDAVRAGQASSVEEFIGRAIAQFKPPTELKPRESLVEFFRRSPLVGVDLDLERSSNTGRKPTL